MMPWQIFLQDSENKTEGVWDDPVLFCNGGFLRYGTVGTV